MIKAIKTALAGVVWLLLTVPMFVLALMVAKAEGKKGNRYEN